MWGNNGNLDYSIKFIVIAITLFSAVTRSNNGNTMIITLYGMDLNVVIYFSVRRAGVGVGVGGGDSCAELFTCSYALMFQARPPRDQRLAKNGAIEILKQLRSMSERLKQILS